MAGGNRGYLMLSRSKARAHEAEMLTTLRCFKCKFFSTNKDLFNRHMTLQHMMGRADLELPKPSIKCFKCSFSSKNQKDVDNHMRFLHLMGPKKKAGMEKFVALSTPNLLVSTLHRNGEESSDSESEAESSDSESDSESEAEHDVMKNVNNTEGCSTPDVNESLNTGFLDSPVTARTNLISQVLKRRRLNADIVTDNPERIVIERSGSSIRISPHLSPVNAETVTNSPEGSAFQMNTSFGSIKLTPPPSSDAFAESVENTPIASNFKEAQSQGTHQDQK